jgi:hypothetical protein
MLAAETIEADKTEQEETVEQLLEKHFLDAEKNSAKFIQEEKIKLRQTEKYNGSLGNKKIRKR